MAGEQRRLERVCKGDMAAVGFRKRLVCDPIPEQLRKLGEAPGLKVTSAYEIDAGLHTRYDYLTREVSACPTAHLGGCLVSFEFTSDIAKPADVLGPIYDFCAAVTQKSPHTWFSSRDAQGWEYEISEARVRASHLDQLIARNSGLEGTYYLSPEKVLGAIERLTMKVSEGGSEYLREMVETAAYFIYQNRNGIPGSAGRDWEVAQKKMVSWFVREMGLDIRYFEVAGELKVPYAAGIIDDDSRKILYAGVLRDLQRDDSIHIRRADIPLGLYECAPMMLHSHRPDFENVA